MPVAVRDVSTAPLSSIASPKNIPISIPPPFEPRVGLLLEAWDRSQAGNFFDASRLEKISSKSKDCKMLRLAASASGERPGWLTSHQKGTSMATVKQAAQQPTQTEEAKRTAQELADKAAFLAAQKKANEAEVATVQADADAVQAAVTAIGEQLQNAKTVKLAGDRSHLKCWHGIGKILHSYLGHKDRHPYGMKVVEEAAQRFKISESELYKAAKFYRLHSDFDAFCAEHADLNNWSKVKASLPGEGGDTEEQRQRKKHRAIVARVQGGLKELRKGLSAGLKASIAEGDLQDFAKELVQTGEQILAPAEPDKPASDEPAEGSATA